MKLAIYDFDGTYVNVQTVPHLFKLFKEKGYNPKIYKKHWNTIKTWYILHKLKLRWDKETFRKNAMAKTIDLLHSLDEKTLHVFMKAFYASLTPLIQQDLKQQLQEDKKEGYFCILLSGSFDVMLKPFLNEGFDEVIGTPSTKDHVRLTSKDVEIIIKDKKVEAIKKRFKNESIEHSKAYADSYYDLPVLLYVDEGICYHPDTQLESSCGIHDLTIIK
jgi:phosphoserine phosphatase